MKKLILIMALALLGCSKDNNVPEPQEDTLIGSWKLVEGYFSEGGLPEWGPVQEQFVFTYTFKANNIVSRDTYECDGVYENTLDYLEVSFSCQNVQSYVKFIDIAFEGDNLILTLDPINCDEGCAYKFKRVNVD